MSAPAPLPPGLRPPSKAWEELLQALQIAEIEIASDLTQSRFDSAQQAGVLRTVIALDKYLMTSRVVAEGRLNAPLLKLLTALRDTVEGHKTELFQPPATPSNHPGRGISGHRLVAVAAKALELLMQAGQNRSDASATVYNTIMTAKGTPLKHPANMSPKTILNWRDQIKADDARIHREVMAQFKKSIPTEAGSTPTDQAAWLLNEISVGLILRF